MLTLGFVFLHYFESLFYLNCFCFCLQNLSAYRLLSYPRLLYSQPIKIVRWRRSFVHFGNDSFADISGTCLPWRFCINVHNWSQIPGCFFWSDLPQSPQLQQTTAGKLRKYRENYQSVIKWFESYHFRFCSHSVSAFDTNWNGSNSNLYVLQLGIQCFGWRLSFYFDSFLWEFVGICRFEIFLKRFLQFI